MSVPRVAYAGLTHLGICSAAAAASKGAATLGFDRDAGLVARLDRGEATVVEPGLDALLREHRRQLAFTTDVAELAGCDLIYVACDVLTDDAGNSDLNEVDALLACVLAHARSDAVVVLLSQVPPGFTRARQPPDRRLYYQVETLVFGRAVERATRPERFILGCPDPTELLPAAWRSFLETFGCPILPMRLESAELAKISINCVLAASVGMANTLAALCERTGADWSEIAPALKLDRRIGRDAYLAPGLGLAGGNIERDLATAMRLAADHGTEAGLIDALLINSGHRRDWALRVLHEALLATSTATAVEPRIGILGLAYKENTDSVKNSPSLALISHLASVPLQIFDPRVAVAAARHPAVVAAPTALDAARGVDALAVMTPWPQFSELSATAIAAVMRGRLVLDPYRVLDAAAARAAGLDYRTLGAG
jgi:UDPglucose 6-dehydrogenase